MHRVQRSPVGITIVTLKPMDFDDVALYPGSLMEWVSDPSNPMATVP
jgi:3-mercaptopyruvate sulfurtransferase SseA